MGQELLTRTKHRGAVRRRIFTVVARDASAAAAEMQVTSAAGKQRFDGDMWISCFSGCITLDHQSPWLIHNDWTCLIMVTNNG